MQTIIAGLAGIIASAAFEPINFWPALVVGILILFKINHVNSLKQRLLSTYAFGIGYQVIALYWVGTYVGSIAWVALVLMQASFFLVLSLARTPFEFALSWVLFEFILRSFPFGGFGWSRIGYALTDSPLNVLYPRISIVGIAFVTVWLSAELSKGIGKRLFFSIATVIALLLIPVNVQATGKTNVALVQGGQEIKLDNTFENAENALERHFAATTRIDSNSVNLVIWPENAIAHDPIVRKSTNKRLNEQSKRINSPILVNGNLADGTNGTVLIGSNQVQSYSKRYLTPFGEFIPFHSLISKISDKAEKVIPYKPGDQAYLFNTESAKFRVLICYELMSDKQARTEMSDSDFLVVQTNNATYFKTWQLKQELSIAQARSAENSKFTAYVSTTGGTAILNDKGAIQYSIPEYENQILVGELVKKSGNTPANKFGSVSEIFLILLFLLLVTRRAFRR